MFFFVIVVVGSPPPPAIINFFDPLFLHHHWSNVPLARLIVPTTETTVFNTKNFYLT